MGTLDAMSSPPGIPPLAPPPARYPGGRDPGGPGNAGPGDPPRRRDPGDDPEERRAARRPVAVWVLVAVASVVVVGLVAAAIVFANRPSIPGAPEAGETDAPGASPSAASPGGTSAFATAQPVPVQAGDLVPIGADAAFPGELVFSHPAAPEGWVEAPDEIRTEAYTLNRGLGASQSDAQFSVWPTRIQPSAYRDEDVTRAQLNTACSDYGDPTVEQSEATTVELRGDDGTRLEALSVICDFGTGERYQIIERLMPQSRMRIHIHLLAASLSGEAELQALLGEVGFRVG